MANKKLRIWCYDTEGDTLYELYEQKGLPSAYDSDDRIVDARSYPENGIDILYFTDNYHELRQIRCEIPNPYTAKFLSEYDLSLQRYGANGTIDFNVSSSITTGGALLSGTYQFSYRLINPDKNVYTKWSSLTNPVHIYAKTESSYAIYASGYGLSTDRKITMTISPSPYELTAITNLDLTHFQLAVVENVSPTASALEASLLAIEPIASRTNYQYKSNYNTGKISIDEIVIEAAAIKTAKTVAISQNRLFAGNIEYNNLEYNNGNPQLDTAVSTNNQFITHSRVNNNDYELEADLSFRKGHFRNEVYRFAIVYFDKYGNKSAPYVLDMTGVTSNSISGATDLKFPDRSSTYPLLGAASNNPVNIGVRLKIKNHPTWAVGFEIVREKRIKKVLFQSPVVPMMSVKGIGAIDTYPSTPTVRTTGTTTLTYASAQPQDPSEVYVPKNLLWPELRNITEVTADANSGTSYEKIKGESKLTRGTEYTFAMLYPQQSVYQNKEYVFTGTEKIETIDFVLAKAAMYDYALSAGYTGNYGDNINDELSTTFFGLEGNYYKSNNGFAPTTDDNSRVVDGVYVDNSTSGTFLGGNRVMTYSNLATQGYQYGFTPSTQRTVVCQLKDAIQDEGSMSISFLAGTHNAYGGGTYVVGSTGATYTAEINYTNDFSVQNSADVNPVQVIRIANVTNPSVGDDRYGKADSQREFISTGAKYAFTQSEITTYVEKSVPYSVSVDVWGGDCSITSHIFKVCDTTYSVVNQRKHTASPTAVAASDLIPRWGNIYKITGSSPSAYISLPVGLKGNAQYIQMFIESEYNGQAMDIDFLNINRSVSGPLVAGTSIVLNGEPSANARTSIRANLAYNYNINLLRENDEKVYFSLPSSLNLRYDFGARIHYSDIKIYNSTNQGFDVFRILNYYDLEEAGGNITKLSLAGDNLYGIQERRLVYLPVGNRQIETADSGILTVGTSSVLSQARIIDPLRGSQHLAGIIEAGSIILIPDKANKAVYMLAGEQIKVISDSFVASTFRSNFGTVFVEKNLRGVYDPVRKEYWIFSNTNPKFCLVYNFALEQWIANYEFDSTLYGGRYTNQNLYLIGKVGSQISVYSMYTGEYTNLMGTEVTPRVTLVVNPDGDYAKTFDDVMISASERLENVDFVVDRELSMGDQLVSEVNLDVFPIEGNYRIKTLRDPRNERLRGLRMKSTVRWKKNNIASAISAIYTKYRLSSRTPF
jgi:hypothetical protein